MKCREPTHAGIFILGERRAVQLDVAQSVSECVEKSSDFVEASRNVDKAERGDSHEAELGWERSVARLCP